jgi:hypothetical protein
LRAISRELSGILVLAVSKYKKSNAINPVRVAGVDLWGPVNGYFWHSNINLPLGTIADMMADRRSLPRQRRGRRPHAPRRQVRSAWPLAARRQLSAGITLVRRALVMTGLMPLSRGTADTVRASLLGIVAEAVASGTWDRLKICRSPDCRWLTTIIPATGRGHGAQWQCAVSGPGPGPSAPVAAMACPGERAVRRRERATGRKSGPEKEPSGKERG